jgi:hypothetical protein
MCKCILVTTSFKLGHRSLRWRHQPITVPARGPCRVTRAGKKIVTLSSIGALEAGQSDRVPQALAPPHLSSRRRRRCRPPPGATNAAHLPARPTQLTPAPLTQPTSWRPISSADHSRSLCRGRLKSSPDWPSSSALRPDEDAETLPERITLASPSLPHPWPMAVGNGRQEPHIATSRDSK